MHRPHLVSGARYPALRALAILYLVAAAITLVGGVITAAWLLINIEGTIGHRLWLFGQTLGFTLIGVILMLTLAEGLKLFMDMAGSLRALSARLSASEPRPTAQPTSAIQPGEEPNEEAAELALIRGH